MGAEKRSLASVRERSRSRAAYKKALHIVRSRIRVESSAAVLQRTSRKTHPMRITLAILAALTVVTLAAPAVAKDKKPSAVKIHMCEIVDVYQGAVDASHPSTRIAESCRDVAPATAQKAIDKCTAKGDPAVCEVLYSADRKTLMIESKIVVSVARGGK